MSEILKSAERGWLSMPDWDLCAPVRVRGPKPDPVELAHEYQKLVASLKGMACWGGMDLGRTDEDAAFVLWFPGARAVLSWFWVSESASKQREERDHTPYAAWKACGWIETTPGHYYCDYGHVTQGVAQLAREFDIRNVALDRWQSPPRTRDLEYAGLRVLPYGQGMVGMSGPAKEIESAVKSHTLQHGGHPVLRWNAGNVLVQRDWAGNIKPDRERSGGKIDGIVALVMAVGASMAEPCGTSEREREFRAEAREDVRRVLDELEGDAVRSPFLDDDVRSVVTHWRDRAMRAERALGEGTSPGKGGERA